MKVYVAAPWNYKAQARVAADRLLAVGLGVTSRWIDFKETQDKTDYEYPGQVMHDEAMHDVEDIDSSDALVYLNYAKSEGKATELGMMIAKRKPIFVVGGKENNVFLHSDYVRHVHDLDEVIARLIDLDEAMARVRELS